MIAQTDLTTLLRQLKPSMRPDAYVFCTVADAQYGDLAHTTPLASFAERAGLTLVLTQDQAVREGLTYTGTFHCIDLTVHSSLEAVGLTARVAGVLTDHEISANVIAAYYHDHIFVPTRDADRALKLLEELSRQS